jgi:hypothetical protein
MTSVRESPAIHPVGAIEGSVESIPVVGGPVVAARPVVRRVGVRAAALRRSREAHQDREVRRRLREVETEAVLADYYQAAHAAEEVMATARARAAARAEQILTEAAKVAAGSQAAAIAALRLLRELGETRAGIRELTGLSAAQVRESLTAVPIAVDADDRVDSVVGPHDAGQAPEAAQTGDGSGELTNDVLEAVAPAGRRPREEPAGPPASREARPVTPASAPSDERTAQQRVLPDEPGLEPAREPGGEASAQPPLF